jgi:LuxR family maltose regulon positive regulatory protein
MVALRIYALGRLRTVSNGTPLRFPTKKTAELLCFLLQHAGATLERDLIAERLWPMRPPGKARRCLSTALWRLRQTVPSLGEDSPRYLLRERHTVTLNPQAPYWFDVYEFEQQAEFGLAGSLPCTEAHLQSLEEALDLYTGDFLEGDYNEWCLAERERLQLLLLRVLRRLQRHYRLSQAFEQAICCGQRLVVLDPLQEDVHRELMRCYEAAGQRSLALAQYKRCQETLHQELQIEPMPETWRLYQRIRRGQAETVERETREARFSVRAALMQFRRALDTMESAWHALQVVMGDIAEGGEVASEGRVPTEQA